MKRYLHAFVLLTFLVACTDGDLYEREIEEWRKERFDRLVSPEGWVALAGLFPIREGVQDYGSKITMDITFPSKAPSAIGSITLKNDSVYVSCFPGLDIMVNGKKMDTELAYPSDTPKIFEWKELRWNVIKRGDKFLLRLRDREHPARQKLTEIPNYPIAKNWSKKAVFVPSDSTYLKLQNVLDISFNNESPGKLKFEHEGQDYFLYALHGGQDSLFVIFYDETSADETYGGGRYMYVDISDRSQIKVDFNKAYSPPCAFTNFATCLLPPDENRLPIAIRAGEKDPHFIAH